MKAKGLIQVYTGDGKGKTTAAVGLACRARGHNLKVCYIYFHKDPAKFGYGEIKSLKKLGVDIFGFAKEHPGCDKKVNLKDIRRDCLKGLDFIKKAYEQNKYDILIGDEINICLRDGFLKEKEVIALFKSKPDNLEVILTGRGASKKLIKLADLVSIMQKAKHPYEKGVKGRKGIGY